MTGPPTSHYREHRPPAPLAHLLVCTWIQRIGPGETCHLQRVLPDGCADIVWIGDRAPVIAGPATRTVIAPLPAGALVTGARLRPGLAPSLLGAPASELLDLEQPLFDLWGPDADRLSAQLAEAEGAAAKLAVLEAALARRPVHAGRADSLVVAAIAWLARRPAGRVGELSRAIGISHRQLQRRFRATVGYGPKALQRILRFQRLLALARGTAAQAGSATLALQAGYADQAHMSREVRALAGRPPSALLAQAGSTLTMSDLFKTPARPEA